MKLPKGCTGFFSAEVLPELDVREYKRMIYLLGLDMKVTVGEVDTDLIGKNYYSAVLGSRILLVNAYHPYAAWAAEGEDGCWRFADEPYRGSTQFVPYQVLTAEELSAPLEELDALDEAERQQIAYWKPRTLGEVLFNDWD